MFVKFQNTQYIVILSVDKRNMLLYNVKARKKKTNKKGWRICTKLKKEMAK